jgi:hypothetical protein
MMMNHITGNESTIQAPIRPSLRLYLWILSVATAIPFCGLLWTRRLPRVHWGVLRRLGHASPPHRLMVAAIAFMAIFMACAWLLSQMVLIKSRVYNAPDARILRASELRGFKEQNKNSEALVRFRLNFDDVLKTHYPDSLSKVVAIRRWVRLQQSQDEGVWAPEARVNHEDPHQLLKEQRQGVPGACRRFSYILLGALLSAGFRARVVGFLSSLNRRNARQHAAVEVWLDELGQWVLLDPTCDTVILVDGKLASAIDLHEAIAAGNLTRISFERNGGSLAPHPRTESYQRSCRHLFVAMSNAVFDGHAVRLVGRNRIRFLHYSRESKYPGFRKQLLLGAGCSSLFLSLVSWTWLLVSLTAA